jgi:hypothetical protein
MKKIQYLISVLALLFASAACAKEIAVLLPITGPLTPLEQTELSATLVTELAAKFDLKYGEEVDRVVKQAFQDESKKKDCDETNCYRRIAEKYQAEKIVALRVVQMEAGHYLVTLQLYDIPTGEVTGSQKSECTACTFEKIKAVTKQLAEKINARK